MQYAFKCPPAYNVPSVGSQTVPLTFFQDVSTPLYQIWYGDRAPQFASRVPLKGVSKDPLGAGLASMDIGSADRRALQNLQIPGHSTNRTLPIYIFPRRFPDKQRLTSSRPGVILVVPMKRVPRTNSRYPLRRRGGRRGNREHSAPATAAPPPSKVRHPSQLLPEQRRFSCNAYMSWLNHYPGLVQ
eukprot:1152122-Pelagomonas_calceolata.AAC.1